MDASDLALWFEAANAGPMSGAWIDDDEGSFSLVYFDSFWRHYTHQGVVYRPLKLATIHDKFPAELQNMRGLFGRVSR